MRILLDTTYLLPIIDISIRGLPEDALIKLIKGIKSPKRCYDLRTLR